jgi:hypothetical protein
MKTNHTKPNGRSMFNVRRSMFNVLSSAICHLPSLAPAKRQPPSRRSGALARREGGRAGALQDASRCSLIFLLSTFCFLLFLTPAFAATRYVWQGSPSPAPPYDSWASAATVIQDAVDSADPGDSVLVAGGVYATGGRAVYGTMTNRVAIDRAITVESLMGPEVTIIQGRRLPGTTNGNGAIRCVYLASGATPRARCGI